MIFKRSSGKSGKIKHYIVYRYIGLLSFIFLSFTLYGQSSTTIDSLQNLLANHQEEDTIKLNWLIELSKLHRETDPENGLRYGEKALALAEQLNQPKQNALAHYFIGQSHHHSDQYDKAMDYYGIAVAAFDALQMKQYLAYCYAQMSALHRLRGEYNEALSTIKKASEINQERNDLVALGYNLDNTGSLFNDLGNLDTAAYYFEQSLEIRKELKDTLALTESIVSMALIQMGHGNYDKALEYSYEALAYATQFKDTLNIGQSTYLIGTVKYYNFQFGEAINDLETALSMFEAVDEKFMITSAFIAIAGCHAELENFEGAILNLEKSLQIAEDFNYSSHLALILSNLAHSYGRLEQYSEALDYGNRALKLQEELNIPADILNSLQIIGDIYLKMGDDDQAIAYSNRALAMIEDESNYYNLAINHEIAYQAHQSKGDYEKAFDHLNNYMMAMDSLYNVEKSTEIANLTSVHDLKEQESENEVLRLNQELGKATIQRQNYLIIGAIVLILILAILAIIVYRSSVQRRKLSTHLATLNDQLNESNDKLKTLNDYRTRLFANINHDFRTPLTLIKGYTDQILANKDNYLTQTAESNLKNLRKNTSMLTQMTSEINNLLLLEEGRLELNWSEIHLLPMLKLIIQMFDSRVVQEGKILQLDTRIADNLMLKADKLYFKKILFNLISNALNHTQGGDAISVEVSIYQNGVLLAVSDTGEGIDPAHLPHIFDRFYQAPGQPYSNREGFGIGLSLVKELVTLHGGKITVESIKDQGTTFSLYLPLNLDQAIIEESDDSNQSSILMEPSDLSESSPNTYFPDQKENTILIVDDHEEIRSYIGSILNQDHNLIFAGHGQQALEVLSKHQVDLIITDLMMPWLDGFELIDQLSRDETLQNIPVLVVSARTSKIDKQKVLKAGVNDFITKPFDAEDLRKRVNNRIKDKANIKANAWQIIASDKDLTSNVEQSILKKIHQLIIDRIDDPNLTVEDVAHEINASRSKTFRLIKELTKQTPKAYIKDIRLAYVHELVKNRKIKNASEGARAVGMLNPTEFRQQYESKFGMAMFEDSPHTQV